MSNPTVLNCPSCGGPMKGDRRVEECSYCNSTIEWYKGPEIPQRMNINMLYGGLVSSCQNLSSMGEWVTNVDQYGR